MKRVAIVGLGWLGMPLAEHLLTQGWQITGSKRQPITHPKMTICPLTFTANFPIDHNIEQLLAVDALVLNLPPSGFAKGEYITTIKRLVCQSILQNVQHLVFISSTSVFPKQSGTFDETATLDPENEIAQLEHWLQQQAVACDILRLGGLIGPQRHPVYTLAGKQNLTGAQQPVNLVHQADCIHAISLLLKQPNGQRTFNLVAPQHPTRQHYYSVMANQFGLAPLHFVADNSPLVRIICGQKICDQLGFNYQFSDPFLMSIA